MNCSAGPPPQCATAAAQQGMPFGSVADVARGRKEVMQAGDFSAEGGLWVTGWCTNPGFFGNVSTQNARAAGGSSPGKTRVGSAASGQPFRERLRRQIARTGGSANGNGDHAKAAVPARSGARAVRSARRQGIHRPAGKWAVVRKTAGGDKQKQAAQSLPAPGGIGSSAIYAVSHGQRAAACMVRAHRPMGDAPGGKMIEAAVARRLLSAQRGPVVLRAAPGRAGRQDKLPGHGGAFSPYGAAHLLPTGPQATRPTADGSAPHSPAQAANPAPSLSSASLTVNSVNALSRRVSRRLAPSPAVQTIQTAAAQGAVLLRQAVVPPQVTHVSRAPAGRRVASTVGWVAAAAQLEAAPLGAEPSNAAPSPSLTGAASVWGLRGARSVARISYSARASRPSLGARTLLSGAAWSAQAGRGKGALGSRRFGFSVRRGAGFAVKRNGVHRPAGRQSDSPIFLPATGQGAQAAGRAPAVQTTQGASTPPPAIFADRVADSTVQVLMSQVKQLGVTGSSTMTVTLIPGSLGKLRFTVAANQNGALAVSIQADTVLAQHLLRQHVGELRSQLSGQGYREVSVDIGAGSGSNGAPANWSGRSAAHQRRMSPPVVHAGLTAGAYHDAAAREGFFAEA